MATTPQERHDAFLAGQAAWLECAEALDTSLADELMDRYDDPELKNAFDDGWAKQQDRYADIFGAIVI
jgi:hypothetical protein